MKRTLRKVGPLSCAKILAALYFALSLLFLPFLAFGMVLPLLLGGADQQNTGGAAIAGLLFAVAAPLCYALIGFLTGLIGGWLYNLFARWLGGIEIEVE